MVVANGILKGEAQLLCPFLLCPGGNVNVMAEGREVLLAHLGGALC